LTAVRDFAAQAAAIFPAPDSAVVLPLFAVIDQSSMAWMQCDSDHPPHATERFRKNV